MTAELPSFQIQKTTDQRLICQLFFQVEMRGEFLDLPREMWQAALMVWKGFKLSEQQWLSL